MRGAQTSREVWDWVYAGKWINVLKTKEISQSSGSGIIIAPQAISITATTILKNPHDLTCKQSKRKMQARKHNKHKDQDTFIDGT